MLKIVASNGSASINYEGQTTQVLAELGACVGRIIRQMAEDTGVAESKIKEAFAVFLQNADAITRVVD